MEFKVESILEMSPGKVWGLQFFLPPDVSDAMLKTGHKRWLCNINNLDPIRCGLLSSKTGYFITINQQYAKKNHLSVGTSSKLVFRADESTYGMEMPEELQVMFDQEPDAFKYFEALTPGKQRNLIYIVNKVKSTDARIKKALAIVAHLTEVNGNLDFKLLNEKIKYFNNQL